MSHARVWTSRYIKLPINHFHLREDGIGRADGTVQFVKNVLDDMPRFMDFLVVIPKAQAASLCAIIRDFHRFSERHAASREALISKLVKP